MKEGLKDIDGLFTESSCCDTCTAVNACKLLGTLLRLYFRPEQGWSSDKMTLGEYLFEAEFCKDHLHVQYQLKKFISTQVVHPRNSLVHDDACTSFRDIKTRNKFQRDVQDILNILEMLSNDKSVAAVNQIRCLPYPSPVNLKGQEDCTSQGLLHLAAHGPVCQTDRQTDTATQKPLVLLSDQTHGSGQKISHTEKVINDKSVAAVNQIHCLPYPSPVNLKGQKDCTSQGPLHLAAQEPVCQTDGLLNETHRSGQKISYMDKKIKQNTFSSLELTSAERSFLENEIKTSGNCCVLM